MTTTNTEPTHETPVSSGWEGTRHGQPKKGARASITKTLGSREVELFSEITGDFNPLHNDSKAAAKSVFGDLITQGGVTSGLLNAVVAEHLPGPGSVFLSTNWSFLKPTYFGEEMTAVVVIEEVREDKPICQLKTHVENSRGEVCIEGTAVTFTTKLG